ncbi:RND family efflux transporter MFP subunit [Cereibacter sphaeroides WS8N]|uniref:efflux RND transporter periplasmic adaptor subunit n=1 Tax=Cereibacter sphaeroides TaxID=1063 RepID=UPI00020B02B0|nr:efflux RND transporter periplasmic adaptor subunit [Cereibacter sphaeroides]EGJ20040.1 RND family efflux transporter MFP subunit [Cereibacter sphaeroides WS8N]
MTFPRLPLVLAALILAAPAVRAEGPAGAERPPSPVTVVTLTAKDYPIISILPGRVTASEVAEVRPQVNGIIRERLFEEGTEVEKDQPLYKIEDDMYAAAVAAARAAVTQAEATLRSAEKDARRAEELFGNNAGSEQRLDTAVATRDAAAAALQMARAELKTAEINLSRTTVRAPIAGTIGLSQTTTGALVAEGQEAPLTTIRSLDRVHVDVTQSATDLLKWRSRTGKNTVGRVDENVALILADGSRYPLRGRLAAAEPQVQPTTGMVTLRIHFPNPQRILLPGMYVQVELPVARADKAVAVPHQAVIRDRLGVPAVWLVTEQNVIEARPVEIVKSDGDRWIVTKGLETGDRVVVAGFQKAAVGAPVTPEEQGALPGPAVKAEAATAN